MVYYSSRETSTSIIFTDNDSDDGVVNEKKARLSFNFKLSLLELDVEERIFFELRSTNSLYS